MTLVVSFKRVADLRLVVSGTHLEVGPS